MKSTSLADQFELLRTKLESTLEMPALVLVSSACAGDGKSATAFGLASSFSDAGYRTVLVDANHLAPTISNDDRGAVTLEQFTSSGPRNFARAVSDESFSALSLVKESLRRNASRPTIEQAVAACRDSYEVIIVDAAPLAESNLAMMLADHVDSIVLTIREGRGVKRADYDLIKMVDERSFPVSGTVTIANATIRDFKRKAVRRLSSVKTLSPVEKASRARTAVG